MSVLSKLRKIVSGRSNLSTRKPRQNPGRPLRFESMEDRRLLAIDVWLDFGPDFTTELNKAVNTAETELGGGTIIADFTPAEITQIQSNVQTQLTTIFTGLGVAFNTTEKDTTGEEKIYFSAKESGLGQSQADWRNLNTFEDDADDYTIEVNPANFEDFIAVAPAAKVTNVSRALANTAAHELGHGLGLSHRDAYGDLRITDSNRTSIPDGNNDPGTPGNSMDGAPIQADNMMVTSDSGSTTASDMSPNMRFSRLSQYKLQFAENVGALSPIAESSLSTLDGEYPLQFDVMNVGGVTTRQESTATADGEIRSALITGNLDSVNNADNDIYRFGGRKGDVVTFHALSNYFSDNNFVDTRIELRDSDGFLLSTPSGLSSMDDLDFAHDSFHEFAGGDSSASDHRDPMLLNFTLPKDDTYTLHVRADEIIGDGGNGSAVGGRYELFATFMSGLRYVEHDAPSGLVYVYGNEVTDPNHTGDDAIDISQANGWVRIDVNGAEYILDEDEVDDIIVLALSGNDQVIIDSTLDEAINTFIFGGDGDDVLIGGKSKDFIRGELGNDTLEGRGNDDVLEGGEDNDTYVFGTQVDLGSDTLNEVGSGFDTLDFSNRPGSVSIDLSSTAVQDTERFAGPFDHTLQLNSGMVIEDIIGSTGADLLKGNSLDNIIQGGEGDDTIEGAGGNDHLDGGIDNDTIDGGAGNDTIDGGSGSNTLTDPDGINKVTYTPDTEDDTFADNLGSGSFVGDTLVGTWKTEIGGAALFDELEVNGLINLDNATLDVDLLGYVPVAGDSFSILTATAGLSGEFETVDFGDAVLADGLAWQVVYDRTTADGDGLEVVLEVLPPVEVEVDAVAIESALSSYSPGTDFDFTDQDTNSIAAVVDNGATLQIDGDGWKKIALPYNVTASTVLEFDFASTSEGEIHGIGFDNDDVQSEELTFRLFGTQAWGIHAFNNYAGGGAAQHYVIPVGQFYTGDMEFLTFINDHDVSDPTASSVFSNVQIYDDPSLAPLLSVNEDAGQAVEVYGGTLQNSPGELDVETRDDDLNTTRETLSLTGNGWRKIDFDYVVTADTVLEFDFSSTSEGEIHAIGFDNNNSQSEAFTFQLFGTQNWGIGSFNDYAIAEGVKHYVIPVGQFYTGSMANLFFVNDHDVANPSAESVFSNIQVYESATVASAISSDSPGLSLAFATFNTSPFTESSRDVSANPSPMAIATPTPIEVDEIAPSYVSSSDSTLYNATDETPEGGLNESPAVNAVFASLGENWLLLEEQWEELSAVG